MVSHANIPIRRMAGGIDRRRSDLFRVDATGCAQRALVAAIRMVLCSNHVLERPRTHAVHHPRTHAAERNFSPSRSGILFVAITADLFHVVAGTTGEDEQKPSFPRKQVAPDQLVRQTSAAAAQAAR